jgi:hypothetical protein
MITPTLLERHQKELIEGSGIDPAVVDARGYWSATSSDQLRALKFSDRQSKLVPGLVLPVHGPVGSNGLYVLKPDSPPVDADGKRQKYLLPWKATPRLDVHPRCVSMLADPSIDAYMTEGIKKGDALASRGYCAIALLGVSMIKAKNDFGAPVLLADFDLIAWKGRRVYVVFDSDVMFKRSVQRALERITAHLTRMGAIVSPIYLPDSADGGKVGVDDYLLNHEDLKPLIGAAPTPPAPVVDLLDEPPLTLSRPLAIVNGRAYAATWLYAKTTTTATVDKEGKVQIYDPPRVETRRELYVVRDDGMISGPGAQRSLDALQAEDGIDWSELYTDFVRDGQCWRTPALKRYRSGGRPFAADVFARLVGLYNHFMAFERSVSTQEAMCELSAVLSLMTWFEDAFDVMPYPWPNGDKGSGKTKWGTLWALTAYLGEVVSAGSSFAAIRDHAALGGTLVVDDAEVLADPKRCDINVRNILLSGNRRGTYVTLKESDGKTWRTRRVHAYAPRGFTAIRLPDDVLRSRSIVLPLVRSADAARQRRDPARTDRWPCDRVELLDDLWALGLSLLVEARDIWDELDDDDVIQDGRLYDCWRAPLTVARLLERHGVEGIEARIRNVMSCYVQERGDDRQDDRMLLLVRTLLDMVRGGDTMTLGDTDDTRLEGCHRFKASEVPTHLKAIADEDADTEWATSSRIGRMLASLRIERAPRSGKERGWLLSLHDAIEVARSYGIDSGTDDAVGTHHTQPSDPQNLVSQASPSVTSVTVDDGDDPMSQNDDNNPFAGCCTESRPCADHFDLVFESYRDEQEDDYLENGR